MIHLELMKILISNNFSPCSMSDTSLLYQWIHWAASAIHHSTFYYTQKQNKKPWIWSKAMQYQKSHWRFSWQVMSSTIKMTILSTVYGPVQIFGSSCNIYELFFWIFKCLNIESYFFSSFTFGDFCNCVVDVMTITQAIKLHL